eukprot:COSAG06_NODE_64873_length_258_cov_0.899371_1_plen_61_part_01
MNLLSTIRVRLSYALEHHSAIAGRDAGPPLDVLEQLHVPQGGAGVSTGLAEKTHSSLCMDS